MKEPIISREFELDDSIYNGVQPLTDKNIELPTELTLYNELVHDVVHHSNSEEGKQNSSFKQICKQNSIAGYGNNSIIGSNKIKSVKERKAVKTYIQQ